MTQVESIIKQLQQVLFVERICQEERWKRGDCFNIFQILGVATSEVRLHSAFLAELLNPCASHGMTAKYLSSFLDYVIRRESDPFEFDVDSAKVYVEYNIGNISADYTTGGRIDLMVQDKNKQTIVIENKIYAGDQFCQMFRYNQFARNDLQLSDNQLRLLYLTLNGDEPSKESLNGVEFKYYRKSYREDILPWLECCLSMSALKPMVRETIFQYINNLKNILSIMETFNNNKFLDILTSEDNVETVLAIFSSAGEIQNRIRGNFINKIKILCDSYGYTFKCDEGVRTASDNNWIHISAPEVKDIEFRIGVKNHTNNDGFRMCFVSLTRHNSNCGYKFWQNDIPIDDEFPFGWTYLWGEDGQNGRWWRWDDIDTLKDMTNGKMLDFINNQLRRIKHGRYPWLRDGVSHSLLALLLMGHAGHKAQRTDSGTGGICRRLKLDLLAHARHLCRPALGTHGRGQR